MADVKKETLSEQFEIKLILHKVQRLIAENYGPAIDFEVDSHRSLYTPAIAPGHILLRDGNEVWRIETDDAFNLFLGFYAEAIRRAFEGNQKYRLESIVWPGFMPK